MKSAYRAWAVAVALVFGGMALAENVLVDIPLDQQINIGNGDAIYVPSSLNGSLSFHPAAPPGEPDGWVRNNFVAGWFYGPYISFQRAGYGDLDCSNAKLEVDLRYYKLSGDYSDAPIFLRIYTADAAGTYLGYRDYSIIYAVQFGDPPHPTWTHKTIWLNNPGLNPYTEGGTFDIGTVSYMRLYGTDWSGDPGAADFIDAKKLVITQLDDVVFYDGTLDISADWSLTTLTWGSGGTVIGAPQPAGGNPGAWAVIETTVNGPTGIDKGIMGCFKRNGAVYDPSTQGAIDHIHYSEDVLYIVGVVTVGQRTGPALFQGGNIYYRFGTTGINTSWTHLVQLGLTSNSFVQINDPNVPGGFLQNNGSHPDFSATGSPIELGFYRGNSAGTQSAGYTQQVGIDNWSVTIVPVTGACCHPDGTCAALTEVSCAANGGTYQGDYTVCDPNPCPQPVGACCFPDGSCTETEELNCAGVWLGMGTVCDPNPCPQPGACCQPDGTCSETLELDCTGTWLGAGTVCDPNLCPQPIGACCFTDGSCTETEELNCSGDWLGLGTSCDPNPCPLPWCLGDSNCSTGSPDFLDIEYFVAALSGEASWTVYYQGNHGGASPPCPYAVNDLNGGGVEFTDIEPFVQHLGQPCDPL